jgi:hypothetical protein
MTTPNYAAEGRIREMCAAAGVRPESLEDVITRFRAYKFTEAELPDLIEEWRATPNHHFFKGNVTDDENEAIAAFGPERSLTAQGAYVRAHGEARAREVAEQYGTTLGGKPGKLPEGVKPKAPAEVKLPGGAKNPWSADAWSVTRQGAVVKALGLEKAQQIAGAAGSHVGAVRPRKVA